MKKIIFLALLLALAGTKAQAQTHTVILNWAAPAATPGIAVAGYYVYRESIAGACTGTAPAGSTCVNINSTPISALTLTDTAPPVGTVFYVVRAVSSTSCAPHSTQGTGACESDNSNEVSAVVPSPTLRPAPPTGLAAVVN